VDIDKLVSEKQWQSSHWFLDCKIKWYIKLVSYM
jgi:hypothetical protein